VQKRKSSNKRSIELANYCERAYEKFIRARSSSHVHVITNRRMPKQTHSSAYVRDTD